MSTTAFVLEPDPAERKWIESALTAMVGAVIFVDDPASLLALLPAGEGDCLIACTEPDAAVVLDLVRELRRRGAKLPAVVIGPHTAFRTAVEIARLEATDFLERPFSERQLRGAVRRVCREADKAQR